MTAPTEVTQAEPGERPHPAAPDPTTVPLRRRLADRPVALTLALGLGVAIVEAWWIFKTRSPGSFDIDEAGYLASALRFARNAVYGPHALISVVGSTENGPLTPLLS